MNKDQLIESARGILPPSKAAADAFEARREAISAELIRRMLERSDLDRLIGAHNREMMQNNCHNMPRFMSSMFRSFDPAVLVESMLWVRRAYRAHGFQIAYWPASMDTMVQILKEQLDPNTFAAVYPCFEWMLLRNPALVELSDAALAQGATAVAAQP